MASPEQTQYGGESNGDKDQTTSSQSEVAALANLLRGVGAGGTAGTATFPRQLLATNNIFQQAPLNSLLIPGLPQNHTNLFAIQLFLGGGLQGLNIPARRLHQQQINGYIAPSSLGMMRNLGSSNPASVISFPSPTPPLSLQALCALSSNISNLQQQQQQRQATSQSIFNPGNTIQPPTHVASGDNNSGSTNKITGNQELQNALASMTAGKQPLQPAKSEPPGSLNSDGSHPPVLVYAECDEESLSEYQCLLRKQVELFEATHDDVQWNAQGRNKAIVLGQVGIRCRHCARLPTWSRSHGAVYYSATLDGLYQAAQNMAKNHLCKHCRLMPGDTRAKLVDLRDCKRRAPGGKKYWAEGAMSLGVIQNKDGLCFKRSRIRCKTGDHEKVKQDQL